MNSSKIVYTLVLLFLFNGSLYSQGEVVSAVNQSQAKIKDQEAKKYLREYRYQKAIGKYSEALALDNKAIYAVRRANTYFEISKLDKAERSYNLGVKLDSTMGLAYLGVARCKINTDLNSDSLDYFLDNALRYCSSNEEQSEALTTLAEMKMLNGDNYLAEKYIVAANNLNPDNLETQAVLARVLFELNEIDRSIELLENIVEKDNSNIRYMINLGYLFNNVGRYQDAHKVLDRALFYEPENPYVLANKAYSLFKTDRKNDAKKVVDKSIKNDQSNAYGHYVKGLMDLDNKDLPKACKCFNRALDRSSLKQDRSFKEIKEAVEANCDNPNKI